jgi:LEA14-like dessication related protein
MRLLTLLPLCLVSFACQSVQRPTATVRGMSLRDIDARGFTMNFDVEMENPNGFTLPLADVDYGLSLGGSKLLSGEARPETSLPANGSRAISLPVTLTFQELLRAEEAIRHSGGDVPYALDATFTFGGASRPETWLNQKLSLPLKYTGTLRLRELLRDPAVLTSPAARELAQRVLGSIFGR